MGFAWMGRGDRRKFLNALRPCMPKELSKSDWRREICIRRPKPWYFITSNGIFARPAFLSPPMAITSVTPPHGLMEGGTLVYVFVNNLWVNSTGPRCKFGDIPWFYGTQFNKLVKRAPECASKFLNGSKFLNYSKFSASIFWENKRVAFLILRRIFER